MVPDETRRDAVMWDCLKQLDELENQTVPKLVFSQTTVQFDAPMAYGEPAVQFVTLRNEGELPSSFRFVTGDEVMHSPLRSGELTAVCASWLSVTPISGALMPRESVQLRLTGCVDKAEAAGVVKTLAEKGGEKQELNDILVVGFTGMTSSMSANAFLQVISQYKGSPWGLSLAYLLKVETQTPAADGGRSASESHFVPRVMRAVLEYLESASEGMGGASDWGEEERAAEEHWAAAFSHKPLTSPSCDLSAADQSRLVQLRALLSDESRTSIAGWVDRISGDGPDSGEEHDVDDDDDVAAAVREVRTKRLLLASNFGFHPSVRLVSTGGSGKGSSPGAAWTVASGRHGRGCGCVRNRGGVGAADGLPRQPGGTSNPALPARHGAQCGGAL